MNYESGPPRIGFAKINQVNLHYLDWSGGGDCLLLLAGFGNTANIYKSFTKHHTEKHRLVALTRRYHGQSETSKEGFDVDTREEDIRQFLNHLRSESAILVGH